MMFVPRSDVDLQSSADDDCMSVTAPVGCDGDNGGHIHTINDNHGTISDPFISASFTSKTILDDCRVEFPEQPLFLIC